mgnify:CR=1 FL=1
MFELNGKYTTAKVFTEIQDVDVADAFIKYKSAEMVYTASLQVTAKIFNNTILDYLR